MNMPLNSIVIKLNLRKEMGDNESLRESMSKWGLLNPIIINKKNELICGHRRYICAKELEWENIEVKIIDISDRLSILQLYLSENITRKNFSIDEIININKIEKKLESPNIFIKFYMKIKNIFINFTKK